METLSMFLLKASLWMLVFWLIYRVFLSRETFYSFNRYFLLAGAVLPFVLPLLSYKYQIVMVLPAAEGGTAVASQPPAGQSLSYWYWSALVIYGGGVLFLLVRNLAGLARIREIINNSPSEKKDGYQLVYRPEMSASFTVFNRIILGWSTGTTNLEKSLILEHELAHVVQKHWLDLLVAQLVCLVQWFNPLSWMLLNAIKQNHEYLADQAVLKKGASPAEYKATLINQALGVPAFVLASSFVRVRPTVRVGMLTKAASPGIRKLWGVLVFPALALFLWGFSEPEYIFKVVPANEKLQTKEIMRNDENAKPRETLKAATVKKRLFTSAKDRLEKKENRPVGEVPHEETEINPEVKGTVTIRGRRKDSLMVRTSYSSEKLKPVYILDGEQIDEARFSHINPGNILAINVYKDEAGLRLYGEKARNGVIVITLKHPEKGDDSEGKGKSVE